MRWRRRWIIFLSLFLDPREWIRHFLMPWDCRITWRFAPWLPRFFLPFLIPSLRGDRIVQMSASAGNIRLETEKYFYKWSVLLGSAQSEWAGARAAKLSELAKYLPKFENINSLFGFAYRAPRLDKVLPAEARKQAEKIWLQAIIKIPPAPCTKLPASAQLGLDLIEKYFPQCRELWQDFAPAFLSMRVHRGFVHGDFHAGNILNASGAIYLIDWDCSDPDGIWEWEAIHFLVEERAQQQKSNWYDAWQELCSGRIEHAWPSTLATGLWLGYYFHRIGQEKKYYKFPEYYLSGIERSLENMRKVP